MCAIYYRYCQARRGADMHKNRVRTLSTTNRTAALAAVACLLVSSNGNVYAAQLHGTNHAAKLNSAGSTFTTLPSQTTLIDAKTWKSLSNIQVVPGSVLV